MNFRREMRVLVVSDSHSRENCEYLYKLEQSDIAIHAGDSQLPFSSPELKNYDVKVRGNCDYDRAFPVEDFINLDGMKTLVTHGHLHWVDATTESIINYAKSNNCQIVIHGHTHAARAIYKDGVYVINPGSTTQSRCNYPCSYMVLELENGVVFVTLKNAKTFEIIEDKIRLGLK